MFFILLLKYQSNLKHEIIASSKCFIQQKNLPFKKPSESAAEVSHLVLVSHANTIGVTFGGQIMSWMEGCATIAAMRHSRRMCITVSVDSLHFLHPIQVQLQSID
jgi:acyl-CoA hydrolase